MGEGPVGFQQQTLRGLGPEGPPDQKSRHPAAGSLRMLDGRSQVADPRQIQQLAGSIPTAERDWLGHLGRKRNERLAERLAERFASSSGKLSAPCGDEFHLEHATFGANDGKWRTKARDVSHPAFRSSRTRPWVSGVLGEDCRLIIRLCGAVHGSVVQCTVLWCSARWPMFSGDGSSL